MALYFGNLLLITFVINRIYLSLLYFSNERTSRPFNSVDNNGTKHKLQIGLHVYFPVSATLMHICRPKTDCNFRACGQQQCWKTFYKIVLLSKQHFTSAGSGVFTEANIASEQEMRGCRLAYRLFTHGLITPSCRQSARVSLLTRNVESIKILCTNISELESSYQVIFL